MTSSNNAEQMLERLLSVRWENTISHAPSNMVLAREYLRRSALWAKTLDCTAKWPLFDVAFEIDSSIRADESMIRKAADHLAQRKLSTLNWVFKTCLWSLHWSTLVDSKGTGQFNLPIPYEPMLVIYERGGSITAESHMIDSSGVMGFTRGTLQQYLLAEVPYVELDEEQLDKLDKDNRS